MRGQFVGTGTGAQARGWHIVIEVEEKAIYVGMEELTKEERWLYPPL